MAATSLAAGEKGSVDGGPEQNVMLTLGALTIVYSLFRHYELGLVRVLPFKAHLALDVLNGVFLLLSPWLFGFANRVWAPHVVLGILELDAVMMTRTITSDDIATAHGDIGGRPVVGH